MTPDQKEYRLRLVNLRKQKREAVDALKSLTKEQERELSNLRIEKIEKEQ